MASSAERRTAAAGFLGCQAGGCGRAIALYVVMPVSNGVPATQVLEVLDASVDDPLPTAAHAHPRL
jgi:hypothetical protein